MSFSPSNLGELGSLATAIGLVDDAGDFRDDWLSDPGRYLASTLADERQREALVAFLDEVLGGEQREEDADGRVWLPLFSGTNPDVTVFLVLDDRPATHVRIGLGVELATADPTSRTRLSALPFRAAKTGQTVPDAILIGQPGGDIGLETSITIDATAPAPGAAHLGGFGLGVRVPTDGTPPTVSLRLTTLQMPGATAPRDLAVSVSDLDELDDAALDLVLGLVRAQVDSAAGGALGALSSLAGMLGLRGASGVPPLPVAELASRGPAAIADWFESVIAQASTRAAWLGEVAGLLGAGASVSGDEVRFTVGPAQIGFSVRVATGAAGRPVVTPVLSALLVDGSARARAEAELLRIDLATGAAVAVPRLSVFAQLGRVDGSGTAILSGDPGVDSVRVGIALDEERRPVFLLAADRVTLAGNSYATLDLSTPDALAESVGTALSDIAADLLAQLGPAGAMLSAIFGLEAPSSDPAVPTLDLGQFLQDPLAAVRGHWRTLLRDHAAAVPELLTTVRDLIADATVAASAVSGAGTAADPWRIRLIGPVDLQVWAEAGGDRLELALAAAYVIDTLGQRCTRVETRLRLGLASLDLAAGSAVFAPGAEAAISARARGSTRAILELGPLQVSADHVGFVLSWRPSEGVRARASAPNLTVGADDIVVPLELPVPGPDGSLSLDAAGWAAVEALTGALSLAMPVPWIADVVAALGWSLEERFGAPRPRLSLAALAADAETELRRWLGALLLDERAPVQDALVALARVLTGSGSAFGILDGTGRPDSPFRLPLLPVAGAPELAAWLGPDGPRSILATGVPDEVRDWRPGTEPLASSLLAEALAGEARASAEIAGLFGGRADPALGFEALITRWRGTDGRIVPPAVDPPGVSVHRLEDVTASGLAAAVDLPALLGGTPATVVHVEVVPPGAPVPWASAPADRVIDLRAAGLEPAAFTPPTPAAGEWFIALADRSGARLATGDADGIAGQAGRLARVLAPFAAVPGGLAVVASAQAGHAAKRMAQEVAAVTALVTLGTPLGAVAFTVLDAQPGADALRLLHALLPREDPAETDDPDLALARGLISALVDRLSLDDPASELQPAATPDPVPRPGLDVHAVFGVVTEDAVRRAITATVAAGLATRAMRRAAAHPFTAVESSRTGIRIPVAATTAGVSVAGDIVLDLFGAEPGPGGLPGLATDRAVRVHLEIHRAGGWLVGGPDAGRIGPRPDHELRWLEANLTVPLGGTADGSAELILHEPRVFTVARDRWTVRADASAAAADEIVTPALPEVRVLLADAISALELDAAASPRVAALLELMRGLGVVGAAGGSVPDAVDHLLHDVRAHIADALADAAKRARMQTAANALLGGVPGLTVDLAGRRIALDLSGSPGTRGFVDWTLHVEADATGAAAGTLTLGTSGGSPAGGAILRVTTAPIEATLEWRRGAAGPEVIRLWPSPDGEAALRSVGRLLPAELLRFALEYLRGLDASARAILDAALDTIGLLTPVAPDGSRRVRLPAALLADPAAWFRHPHALGNGGGFSPARAAALLDAAKPIVGVTGGPGEWSLASGVRVTASDVDGNLRLAVALDTSGFAPPAVAARLMGMAQAGLTIRPGQAPTPSLALAIGLPGAAPGRRALHVALNGSVRVFLRPDTGPDLPLYPEPPGLGQLAQVAVTHALPLILDELAALSAPGLPSQVAAVVREAGDALALRSGSPARFDGAALQAWANDPAGALAARLPALAATALNALASALDAVLPTPASASAAAGEITVTVGSLTAALASAPFRFRLNGTVTAIPGVERVHLELELDATGPSALIAELGPAALDAGGVTLRPYLGAAAGHSPASGRRVEVGLGLDAGGTRAIAARWNIDGGGFALVARDGGVASTDAEDVALALLDAVLDLVASFALSTTALQDLLAKTLPGSTTSVRDLLRGVLLDASSPSALDTDLFLPARLPGRIMRLIGNFADAAPSVDIGGGLLIGIAKTSGLVELRLSVNGRVEVVSGDVYVAVEADSRWIQGTPPSGILLGVLREIAPNTFTIEPGLSVNGVGIRVGRSSGPLIEAGLTLGSVALHGFGRVNASEKSGGAQIQFSELAVGIGGASGGNPIAQGMLADASAGSDRPAPAFSPALAIQKHGGDPVSVSLRAGEGDGPWWLAIQKGFGPLYIEQVGLGVTERDDQLERISLLLDGRVSVFGLTAAVDDLQLTFVVASDASPFDPSRWSVDLAGLAISADMGGVVLVGGLRKFSDATSIEYIGMLVARFAAYGLSVFGGYGEAQVDGQKFAAFFAFGAVVGPIGGPPAFFLTGIGGGLGINRGLVFPTDMSRFGDFVFLKALDPGATPSDDPMAEMLALRETFPMRRGEFWFAAGISFNSFALVDGVAVLAVAIGDGLEITLLGLARMALPRPQVALVSIELGLIARFSTREGVLWIQAQLTDNSWLLHESVRLTGGFAFVTWFKGPYAGQFVLTLGGFHPSFHRDGYPIVPRLGFRWSVSNAIVIKGENYFALTSEAVMAGGRLEASAEFGPAWASLVLGADGIVYFDPFRFQVEVYARISAGVTIDVWIGEITISVSLGARILLEGPKFRGKATFEVGPVELTVRFGSWDDGPREHLEWSAFVEKYLEVAEPGRARVLTALPGKGQVPPGTGPGGNTDTATADGSAHKPFEVLSEFEITVTTLVPTKKLRVGTGAETSQSVNQALGIAPMNTSSIAPLLELHLRDTSNADHLSALHVDVLRGGGFPVGVWGQPQDDDDRKVPKGDVISAVDHLRFEAIATFSGSLLPEIPYHQVETGPRKPLPFVHEGQARSELLREARRVGNLLPPAPDDAAMYALAEPWLAMGGNGRTAIAALRRDRTAPPRLGSLTEGLAARAPGRVTTRTPAAPTTVRPDTSVHPAEFIAVLSSDPRLERARVRTTVAQPGTAMRATPPDLTQLRAGLDPAIATMVTKVHAAAAAQQGALLPPGTAPLTRGAHGGTAAVAARGAHDAARARLNGLNDGLFMPAVPAPAVTTLAAAAALPAPMLVPGEVAVLRMPNAVRDTGDVRTRPRLAIAGGPARVVVLGPGGRVMLDGPPVRGGVTLAEGADRIAVLALGDGDGAAGGLSGWHAGQELAYIGWSTALAPGALVQTEGGSRLARRRQRFRAGWTPAAELIADATIVSTRFADPVTTVIVALDDPGAEAGHFLSLDLTGADRPLGRDGKPVPPALVVAGNRSLLVYAVAPAGKGEAVTVTIAREPGWRIAGVLGTEASVARTVDRLARVGLDALARPYAAGRGGALAVRWSGSVPRRAVRAREIRTRVRSAFAGAGTEEDG